MTIQTVEVFRLAFEKPPGYMRLLQFCKQVEAGEVPDNEMLQDLSKAFLKFIEAKTLAGGQSAFADVMELKQKDKSRPKTAKAADRRYAAAYLFAYYQLKGLDRNQALEKAAEESNYTTRHVERCYDEYGKQAEGMAHNILKFEDDSEWAQQFLDTDDS